MENQGKFAYIILLLGANRAVQTISRIQFTSATRKVIFSIDAGQRNEGISEEEMVAKAFTHAFIGPPEKRSCMLIILL